MIAVSCDCGRRLSVKPDLAGRRVKCPDCGQPIVVPTPPSGGSPQPEKSVDAPKSVRGSCPCGARFNAPAIFAGKKVRCPQCGKPTLIAQPGAATAAGTKPSPGGLATAGKSAKPAKPGESGLLSSLLDEVGVSREARAGSCPACREPLEAEAVICVRCGFNLETGRKLGTKKLIREAGPVGKAHLGGGILHALPLSVQNISKNANRGAIACVIYGIAALCLAVVMASMPDIGQQIQKLAPSLNLMIVAILGGLALVASMAGFFLKYAARNGRPSTRNLAMLGGLLMVLAVPVGTIFGLLVLQGAMHGDTKRYFR